MIAYCLRGLMDVPAEILAGEAVICGWEAMLAIAWIYGTGRNRIFYGWHDEPGPVAEYVAANWQTLPDTSNGGRFVFSAADLADARVQALVGEGPPVATFDCEHGYRLEIY